MKRACGRYYFIVTGMIKHFVPIKSLHMIESNYLRMGVIAIKVFIPDSVKLTRHVDKELSYVYYTTKDNRPIEEFQPEILTYIYGEWKKLLEWSDIKTKSIFSTLEERGYTYDEDLGFMSKDQIQHHNQFIKMLFG